MYVCVCNAFTDRDLEQAIASGEVRTVSSVYRACGGEAQCAQCVKTIREYLGLAGLLPFRRSVAAPATTPDF